MCLLCGFAHARFFCLKAEQGVQAFSHFSLCYAQIGCAICKCIRFLLIPICGALHKPTHRSFHQKQQQIIITKMLLHCSIRHSTTQLAGSFTELVRSLQILHQQPCRFSSSSAAGEGGKDSSSSTSDGGGGQGMCAASCCLPTALLSCIVKQHQFTHTLLLVCR